MRVLIISTLFFPSIGGSQTNAEILAEELVKLNCEVRLITSTPGSNFDRNGVLFSFKVIRRPSVVQILRHILWCDVCLQNGVMLKSAWLILLARKPLVIRHQTWFRSIDQPLTFKTFLKKKVIEASTSIAISQQIANHLPLKSEVIYNPYRDNLFQLIPGSLRDKDLVYLGRLVKSKGVHLLIEAVYRLKTNHGLMPKLTVIGHGPELANLRQQVLNYGLDSQVNFVGQKTGESLVEMLNQHQIMVIPSLWNEPFGVVALEGIACGCAIIGSAGGGLKEAIGPCGKTFPNGDVDALTKIIADFIENPKQLDQYRAAAPDFLAFHRQAIIAKKYLTVLKSAASKNLISKGHLEK